MLAHDLGANLLRRIGAATNLSPDAVMGPTASRIVYLAETAILSFGADVSAKCLLRVDVSTLRIVFGKRGLVWP